AGVEVRPAPAARRLTPRRRAPGRRAVARTARIATRGIGPPLEADASAGQRFPERLVPAGQAPDRPPLRRLPNSRGIVGHGRAAGFSCWGAASASNWARIEATAAAVTVKLDWALLVIAVVPNKNWARGVIANRVREPTARLPRPALPGILR